MAIQRSTSAAIAIGTSGSTSGLFGLTTSATVGAQSAVVVSGTTANITDIAADLDIVLPSIASPTASTKVDIYCWGTQDEALYPGGSTGNEVITGSAGTITVSATATLALKWIGSVVATLTSTVQTVHFDGSISAPLGFIPRRWGLAFINNTGATLATTGHSAKFVETYYN